jgi:ankyrin repeat protein
MSESNFALLAQCTSAWPDLDRMREHLEAGADPNVRDSHGTPVLHILASRPEQKLDAARLLIEFNVDVNATSDRQQTALGIALNKGHVKMAELLLQKKIDPNIDGGIFTDPLLAVAAGKGYEQIVILLLQQGANIHALTDEKKTAEQVASIKGHIKIAFMLASLRTRPERCAKQRAINDANLIKRGVPTKRPLQAQKRISLRIPPDKKQDAFKP